MPTIEYKLREGYYFRGDIKPVAERIEALKRRHAQPENPEGFTTPEEIFEDGTDPTSPLHPHFVWDRDKAFRFHNLDIAANLLRSYEVHIIEPDRKPIVISPANVVIRNQPTKSTYVSASYAMKTEDNRKQVIDDCIGLVKGAQSRLASLQGISQEVIALLGQAIEAMERDKKKLDQPPKGKAKQPKKGDQPPQPFSPN